MRPRKVVAVIGRLSLTPVLYDALRFLSGVSAKVCVKDQTRVEIDWQEPQSCV